MNQLQQGSRQHNGGIVRGFNNRADGALQSATVRYPASKGIRKSRNYRWLGLSILAGMLMISGCSSDNDSIAAETDELLVSNLRSFYTAVNEKTPAQLDALTDIITPDFRENTPNPGFPATGDDRQDLIDRVTGLGIAAPDFLVDNQRIFITPTHAAVWSIASGTLEQDLLGFPGNGTPFSFGAIDVWEYDNDRNLTGIWHQEDFLSFASQLNGTLSADSVTASTEALSVTSGGLANEANQVLIDRFYRAFEGGGGDELRAVISADLLDMTPNPALPGSGNDAEDLVARAAAFKLAIPDIQITNNAIFSTNSFAIVASTVSGTQQGDLLGIPGTGRSFEFRAIDILGYENGVINQLWHYEDLLGLTAQLTAQ